MIRTYRTPKGTDLPLLNLKGKEYLEVKYRLVWFREERPLWRIKVDFVELTDEHAFVRAEILDETGATIVMAHKFEDKLGFADFREKAETGAIGRALAFIGYGTQFCAEELDEGNRIVDAPVTPPGSHQELEPPATPGDVLIVVGKKYRGRKLRDVPNHDLLSYVNWLALEAEKKRRPIGELEKELTSDVARWIEYQERGS